MSVLHSFLMAESRSSVWMDHILLVHSPVDGHSAGFHLLATVNSATVNIRGQVFVGAPVLHSFGSTWVFFKSSIYGSNGQPL